MLLVDQGSNPVPNSRTVGGPAPGNRFEVFQPIDVPPGGWTIGRPAERRCSRTSRCRSRAATCSFASQGNLCLGAPQVRFAGDVLNAGANGAVTFEPDLNALPQGTTFVPGDVWNFQLSYRDQNPGTTSNTTDGIAVVFCI
ncbi:MAG: hypothetical protein GY711_23500 [bacterium]|nr:hypothetical protein [bacterium]